jgi:hypothetical protein
MQFFSTASGTLSHALLSDMRQTGSVCSKEQIGTVANF